MWRATNSGVSSNMWMKPCSSRRMSFGRWRDVRVSPYRKIGMSALRRRTSVTNARSSMIAVAAGQLAVPAGLAEHEFVVVDRQDEARRAARLLRERRQITVARETEDFDALLLDRFGQRPDAGSRCSRAEIFVDDDDGKRNFMGDSPKNDRGASRAAVTRKLVRRYATRSGFRQRDTTLPLILPPRSAYDTSHTSSLSKKSTWATPSFA